MNNYYTLIYLIREWNNSLSGSTFAEALSVRRDTLDIYFNAGNSPVRMTFCSDPKKTALFTDRYQQPKRNNAASFFHGLAGKTLCEITLAERDRYITFHFSDAMTLVFLLYSNGANVFLTTDELVSETFKKNDSYTGKHLPAPQPVTSKPGDPFPDSLQQAALFAWVTREHPLLPRPVLRWLLHQLRARNLSSAHIQQLLNGLPGALSKQAFPHVDPAYGFSIIQPEILGSSNVRSFSSVNDAVAYTFYQAVRASDYVSVKQTIQSKLQQFYNRLSRSVEELENLDKGLERAAILERNAHLLMANPGISTEAGVVEVADYFDEGTPRRIEVSASSDAVRNAERFYQRARSARKSHATAATRMEQIIRRRNLTQTLLQELDAIRFSRDLDKWMSRQEDSMRMLGIQGAGDDPEVLPYKRFYIDSFEIRVGKSAQHNDALLRISHKEDIWLHARGVAGSHVIIPMQRSASMPARAVLESAAEIAAFFSKGKGSSLLPVIFTKKKFVRKPKGAAPGAVRVDKEEVLLVEPQISARVTSEIS